MIYVLDSSFVAALTIPDEKNPKVDKMYDKIENEDEKYAPHLLWYELTNVYKNLLRRRRFSIDEVMYFYPRLAAIQLVYDNETGIEYSKRLLHLCNEYNLSAYDTSYLELAERKRAILCTLDEGLEAAAEKHGVQVLK